MEQSRAQRRELRKRRARRNRAILLGICLVLCIIGFLIFKGCSDKKTEGHVSASSAGESAGSFAVDEPLPSDHVISLNIRCAGDIMAHEAQTISAYRSEGYYNYENHFKYVQGYLLEADLAMANLESSFKGKAPYKGYPLFNAPDQLAFKTAEMGIDVAIFANNHMIDQGLAVTERSVDVLRSYGMVVAGAQHAGEPRYQIIDVDGVNIGVVAYTYETARSNGRRTLNGLLIPSGGEEVINSFSLQDAYMENDLKSIETQIASARSDGAQVVILYMHWGEEYQKNPNSYQKNIAKRMAAFGADIIFASHPHVPQGIEVIESAASDGSVRRTPVFYSMGNFISNQRSESLTNTYGADAAARTEQEYIANVDISWNVTQNKLTIDEVSFIPLWVDRWNSGGRNEYAVIPLTEGFEQNPALAASGHLSRAQKALTALTNQIGAEYLYTKKYVPRTSIYDTNNR